YSLSIHRVDSSTFSNWLKWIFCKRFLEVTMLGLEKLQKALSETYAGFCCTIERDFFNTPYKRIAAKIASLFGAAVIAGVGYVKGNIPVGTINALVDAGSTCVKAGLTSLQNMQGISAISILRYLPGTSTACYPNVGTFVWECVKLGFELASIYYLLQKA